MQKLSLIFFILLPLLVSSITPEELLRLEARPDIETTLSIPIDSLERVIGPIGTIADTDLSVLNYYETVIPHLLEKISEHNVYLMARDMEDLYEALQVTLSQHPQAQILRSRVQMLAISRKLAEQSTNQQLVQWMKVNGIDFEKLQKSDAEKVFWLDTGYSGKIYRKMFVALLSQISDTDPLCVEKMTHVFANITPLLLASWEEGTFPEVVRSVKLGQFKTPSELINKINRHEFHFEELIPDRPGRVRREARGEWLINNVERRRANWRGRGMHLSLDGTRIVEFEAEGLKDSRIDRKRLIRDQIHRARYFSTAAVADKMLPYIERALAKLPPIDLPLWNKTVLTPGVKFQLSQRRYEVMEVLKERTSTRVLKLRSLEDGGFYSFKYAVEGSTEGIEKLKKDFERIEQLQKNDFVFSAVVEQSENYLLRKWAEGSRADAWLADWGKMTSPERSLGAQALEAFLQKSIHRGIYVRNLRPSNMIWNGKEWVIINSGSTVKGLTRNEARARYQEGLIGRWERHATSPCKVVLSRINNGTL